VNDNASVELTMCLPSKGSDFSSIGRAAGGDEDFATR
jgi:hypothetical protein